MKIKNMLPFLEDEELAELAKKIVSSPTGEVQGVKLEDLLPYMDDDDIDEMMMEAFKNGENVDCFLPFASDDGIEDVIDLALAGKDMVSLKNFLPFADDETIEKIADKALLNGGTFAGVTMDELLPFLDDDYVDEVFLQELKKGGDGYKKYVSFASDDALSEAVQLYLKGQLDESVIDTLYPFLDEDDIKDIFHHAINSAK
jgi:hypothetical protein